MTRFLLDTNVFIQGKNLHYGFDFCPAFWQWLIEQNASELQAGGDDLSDWATARGRDFFLPPDDAVVLALARVSTWASN